MLNKVLVAGLLFSSLFVVTPALALNGYDAAVKCENTPGCFVTYDEGGGITIFGPKGGVVMCTSPTAQCTAGKRTNAPRSASLRLLQLLGAGAAAPDTTSEPTHKKKPAMVFNLNDGNNGNSGGGKSGTPMGQGGKPVKNDGGGKSVTPHNFTFSQPKKIS